MVLETGECCGPAVVPGCQSCGATVVFSTIEHYPWTDAVGALLQRVEDRCALDLALCAGPDCGRARLSTATPCSASTAIRLPVSRPPLSNPRRT
jgi:hypothetical protein